MLQHFPMYAYLPAKDVARARQFYEGKLGFTPKQEIAGGVLYEFQGKTACFLYPTPNAGTSKASQAFWQVDDVEREVAELKKRGVKFEDYDMPGRKESEWRHHGRRRQGGLVQGHRGQHPRHRGNGDQVMNLVKAIRDFRADHEQELFAARSAVARHQVGRLAVGALALGAVAAGAWAVGALAVGRLAIGRARVRHLEIDKLVVRDLRVAERYYRPRRLDEARGHA